MFDLIVQATQVPSQPTVPRRKIGRGLQLMHRPGIVHQTLVVRQRLIGPFHNMRQLKNNRHNKASNQVNHQKACQDRNPR